MANQPLAFTRTYNSTDARVRMLGQGWTHSFEMRLRQREGSQDNFVETAWPNRDLIQPAGRFLVLVLLAQGIHF